jgi:hypothetical protein
MDAPLEKSTLDSLSTPATIAGRILGSAGNLPTGLVPDSAGAGKHGGGLSVTIVPSKRPGNLNG